VSGVQELLAIPLIGVIPEDERVIISSNRGEPLVLAENPLSWNSLDLLADWKARQSSFLTWILPTVASSPASAAGYSVEQQVVVLQDDLNLTPCVAAMISDFFRTTFPRAEADSRAEVKRL